MTLFEKAKSLLRSATASTTNHHPASTIVNAVVNATAPIRSDNGDLKLAGTPANPLSAEEAQKMIASFPYWYQRIYLGNDLYTLPHHAYHEDVWSYFAPTFPKDLQGASVLDIGCNAGYFSIQTKLRNAGHVLGLEMVDDYFRQADLCKAIWGTEIEYRLADVHTLGNLQERFDIAIFTGILYHLENPLQVLREVGRLCNDAVILETEIIQVDPTSKVYVRLGKYGQHKSTPVHTGIMKFIERDEMNGDGSNWWIPDTECVYAMLRSAGFQYFSKPVYLTHNHRLLLVASKKEHSILDYAAFA